MKSALDRADIDAFRGHHGRVADRDVLRAGSAANPLACDRLKVADGRWFNPAALRALDNCCRQGVFAGSFQARRNSQDE